MNILLLGGSGSSRQGGMASGILAQFPGARATNKSVGNSPGTQFAYYGGMNFRRFDAVVFSSGGGPDDTYLEQAGGFRFVSSLYYELFSTIQAQTNLYVVGAAPARFVEHPSEAYYMHADLAEATGARFVSRRDFMLAHGESIVPKGVSPMADEAHVHLAIGQQFGHHLGRVIAETVHDRRPGPSFARNFRRVAAGHVFDGKRVARRTHLAERRFAEMGPGDRLRFGLSGRLVGMHVDYWNTYAFARLAGPDGTLVKRMYIGHRPGRMLLQFIPVLGETRFDELEIVEPTDTYQDSLIANIQAVAPAPVASIAGLAFWDGEIRDLGLSRRGASTLSCRVPVIDPETPLAITARDLPATRGWHAAAPRPDVGWSRWTGPDSESVLVLDCRPGRHRMRLVVLGAVAEAALSHLRISVDGIPAPVDVSREPGTGHVATAVFEIAVAGPTRIVLAVPVMRDGYGLEVARLEFSGAAV